MSNYLPLYNFGFRISKYVWVLFIIELYIFLTIVVVGAVHIYGIADTWEEIRYEIKEFIDHYSETVWWWITSLIASILALTIGSTSSLIIDIVVLSIFFVPAAVYFRNNYPFSLDCEYRHHNINFEKDNIVPQESNGEYVIDLSFETGSNVDEFSIDIDPPRGVNVRLGTKDSQIDELTGNNVLKGTAPPGRDQFTADIIINPKNNHKPAGKQVIFTERNSDRVLTTVTLQDTP